MSDLTLEQRLRCSHVKRWHMVRVFREQTLAEHLMLVQIVALEAADRYIAGSGFHSDPRLFRLEVMEWAMWHDMPEVVTGDIAPPTKKLIEHSGGQTLLNGIEKRADGRFARLDVTTGEVAKLIVRFADMYDAIRFLHWEGHGPRALEIERMIINSMADHIKKTRDVMLDGLADVFQSMFDGMTYDSNE